MQKIMKQFIITLLFILYSYICFASNAPTVVPMVSTTKTSAPQLIISGGYARSSVAPNNNSAAYMTLRNDTATAYEIIGASSVDIANRVEIHQSYVDDKGISRMVSVDKLVIPAHSTVELKPGGTHIMLLDLRVPQLKPGTHFKILLHFKDGQILSVPIEVQAIGG